MVARGAGAAGPVLLACRQWHPLGLAQRLPSLGVGAWRCAPLLPRLCVRGVRGRFGGFGSVPGVVSLSFPPPRPACSALRVAGRPVRVSLTLARWYAIPRGWCVPRARSGCPSGSPRVSLSCMCARAPAASAPPPPWVVWRAHLAWSRHWALVGPFHVVRAPPRVLPRSLAPSGVLGGGRSGPGSPLPGLGLWGWRYGLPGGVPSTVARGVWGQALPLPRPPAHWAGCRGPRSTCCGRGRAGVGALRCPLGRHALWGLRAVGRVRGFRVQGGRAGGGACTVPPVCAARGGPVGRGVALPHSVPLPSLGRQQSGCHWRCAVHGGRGPRYHSDSCSPGFSGCDLCGVLARWRGLACSSRPPWEPAAGTGGRVALRLFSRAGGGPSPLPRGVGAGTPAACGPVGGRGGGVSRRGLSAPLLGGGLRYPILAPLVSSARSLPACACARGRSAAPGWGGVRGGPWTAPPGALADLNPPPDLPEWAVVTGGSCGARPPYCSVVRVVPAR